ncbi:hypothetical protein ABKV19_002690 [Rosa sericea]
MESLQEVYILQLQKQSLHLVLFLASDFPQLVYYAFDLFRHRRSSWRWPEILLPEWFTCRRVVDKKGRQVCEFRIDFPGNFKREDKGLAFCAQTVVSGPTRLYFTIYINSVCIIEASQKTEDFMWRRLSGGSLWLYYMPFDTIIKRLSESGSPPPSVRLVKFKIEGSLVRSCGVHVVMPEDEGQFVNDCQRIPPFSRRELKIDAEEMTPTTMLKID